MKITTITVVNKQHSHTESVAKYFIAEQLTLKAYVDEVTTSTKSTWRFIFEGDGIKIKVYATPVPIGDGPVLNADSGEFKAGFKADAPAYVLSASIVDAADNAAAHPLEPRLAINYHAAQTMTTTLGEMAVPDVFISGSPTKGNMRELAGELQEYNGADWVNYGPSLSAVDASVMELQLTLSKGALEVAAQCENWWKRQQGMAAVNALAV